MVRVVQLPFQIQQGCEAAGNDSQTGMVEFLAYQDQNWMECCSVGTFNRSTDPKILNWAHLISFRNLFRSPFGTGSYVQAFAIQNNFGNGQIGPHSEFWDTTGRLCRLCKCYIAGFGICLVWYYHPILNSAAMRRIMQQFCTFSFVLGVFQFPPAQILPDLTWENVCR